MHSLFVDDTLLFGSASINEAKKVKKVLDVYTHAFCQRINSQKSKVYTFHMDPNLSDKIVNVLGFSRDDLPSTYLGIPFFTGKNKPSFWQGIINCIKARILVWKARWLSLSGRILLIKSILSAIPSYYFSVLQAPKLVLNQIKSLISDFL